MITAYTVITGNYDNLRAPVRVGGGRYVCFSDRPRSVAPWETQPFPMLAGDPHHNSRIPKCLPHLLLDTDISIYMDGAFKLLAPLDTAARVLGDADIALFAHPGGHKSIHDERNFYARLHGYVPADVEAQYQCYVAEGVPDTGQFYAGGLVIRRHTPKVEAFNELWFREYMRGSSNDQFSLYYAIWKTGVTVATIPGVATMDTVRFGYCLHANSGCGDNPKHEGENAMWAERMRRIEALCA